MSRERPFSLLFICGVALLGSRAVRAEPTHAPSAEKLFTEAIALREEGNDERACEKFRASHALDPAVATLIQVADCLVAEGRTASAWYAYRQALKLNRKADKSPALDRRARQAIARIEPRIPRLRLVIVNAPTGTEATRDGEPIPRAAWGEELFVDPIATTVAVEAPGHAPFLTVVEVKERETRVVTVELAKLPAQEAPKRASPPTPAARPSSTAKPVVAWSSRHLVGGVVLSAISLTMFGVAGGFAGVTWTKLGDSDAECDSTNACSARGLALRDEARTAQTRGLVFLVGGAIVAGGGVLLFATAPIVHDARVSVGFGSFQLSASY